MAHTFSEQDLPGKCIRISAMADDKEVGHAILYLIKNDLHDEPYGLLEDLMVDEAYRSQGIGKQLVQKIIDAAVKEKCYKLLATSRFEREHVHKLYEGFGFKQHGLEFRLEF